MSDSDSDDFNCLITNGELNFWKNYQTRNENTGNRPSTSNWPETVENKRKLPTNSDSDEDYNSKKTKQTKPKKSKKIWKPASDSETSPQTPKSRTSKKPTKNAHKTNLLDSIMQTLSKDLPSTSTAQYSTPDTPQQEETTTRRVTRGRKGKKQVNQPNANVTPVINTRNKRQTRATRSRKAVEPPQEDPCKTPPYKQQQPEEINSLVDVKVLWKSIYQKIFKIRRFSPLKVIVDYFAKKENVNPKHICFSIADKIVDLTAHSCVTLKYRAFDEIEGGILDCDSLDFKLVNKDEKGMKLKVRQNRRVEYFTLNEHIKCEHLYAQVVLKFGLTFGNFKLEFDGVYIDSGKSIKDNGLEDGDCIDIL